MSAITRKSEIRPLVANFLKLYQAGKLSTFSEHFYQDLLTVKVKFPLLEWAAESIHAHLLEEDHIPFCEKIAAYQTIGGNVVVATILKLRLPGRVKESLSKAVQFIAQGQEWYVSDIIGERVFGNGILQFPTQVLPRLRELRHHESQWVVRSIGAGSHLATKRGLDKAVATEVFQLLLQLGGSTNYQIRRGIGWAAKTMARFHPDIIEDYTAQIQDEHIGHWFRKKVNIGLERHRHAQSHRS